METSLMVYLYEVKGVKVKRVNLPFILISFVFDFGLFCILNLDILVFCYDLNLYQKGLYIFC